MTDEIKTLGDELPREMARARQGAAVTRPLSKSARDARKPLPPEVLAGARQETVHVESGKWRRPKSAKVRTKEQP